MASEIRQKFAAKADFTLSLGSLGNGSARQSDMIVNTNKAGAAMVYLRITSGTNAPTSGSVYEVYLLRGDDAASSTYRSDGAGPSDAAITIENAPLLGVITVTNTASKVFYGEFDTSPLGPLGPEWGIAVKNSTGQAIHNIEGNHVKKFAYYVPESQ